MRKISNSEIKPMTSGVDHSHAKEYEQISDMIDSIPEINEMVYNDLTNGAEYRPAGANGMSAEQVLRAAIIKQAEGFSYEELAFHLVDSRTYRNFCRIGDNQKCFKKSALCKNIKALSPETWENVNKLLVAYGEDQEIEKGKETRIDCTVVETNIHKPADSDLLWDGVRVITRKLGQICEFFSEIKLSFGDHTKRAKRRMISNSNFGSN